jgi:hypothetical protein
MGLEMVRLLELELKTYDREHTRLGVRPWRRTDSGCCFDRLPGVVVLELGGAQIAES